MKQSYQNNYYELTKFGVDLTILTSSKMRPVYYGCCFCMDGQANKCFSKCKINLQWNGSLGNLIRLQCV